MADTPETHTSSCYVPLQDIITTTCLPRLTTVRSAAVATAFRGRADRLGLNLGLRGWHLRLLGNGFKLSLGRNDSDSLGLRDGLVARAGGAVGSC